MLVMKKKAKKLANNNQSIRVILFVIAFAVILTSILLISHAATSNLSIQPESGALSGNVTRVNDFSASDGHAVQFSKAVVQPCTSPTNTIPMDPNDPQAGVTISGLYLTNDSWNAAGYSVSQTMKICNYNNWNVVATMNNSSGDGAVKTYPNVHKDFSSPLISSFTTISSGFSEISPHVGIYEYAYDIWLNGVASPGSTELMIWNDNYNQVPAGTVQGTFSSGGRTYSVWKIGSYIAFVDTVNTTAGTVNLLDFMNYAVSNGWITSTSKIGQIDYGAELVSTNNVATTFAVNDFSLTTK
jgi:hypothetical protein